MKTLMIVICLSLVTVGCGTNVRANDDSVTMPRKEYEALKAQSVMNQQVGRYQIHHAGFTTWRLDTVTGKQCLLLADKQYWRTEGKGKSCTPDNDPLGIR